MTEKPEPGFRPDAATGREMDTIADYPRVLETIDPELAQRLLDRQEGVANKRTAPGRRRNRRTPAS